MSCSDDQPDPPAEHDAAVGGGADDDAGQDDSGHTDAGSIAPDSKDEGTDAGPAAEVLTEAEACRRYVAYYCERRLFCGITSLEDAYSCFYSAELCPDMYFSPGSTRTVEQVTACAKAWLDHPCDDVLHERSPACATPGTRELGESCVTNSQCKSSRCTAYVTDPTCGKCVAVAASGGACSTELACPRDEMCTNGKCMPRQLVTPSGKPSFVFAPGQACTTSSEPNFGGCTLGTVCDTRPGVDGSYCYYEPGPGERCYHAAPHTCWGEGDCDGHTCAPIYPCSDSLRTCERGEVCVCSDAECKSSSCSLPRQEGQTCMLPAMPCADRLECVQGICQRAKLPSLFEKACK
ncbi:MAG TPA: hypothetical protein VJR89_02540 [Polyangiales bacterium]|nr:hypothetical protein [Polyangiales bacterium]